MATNFFTDFGFTPEKSKDFKDIKFGPKKNYTKLIWTIAIYIALSLGIFLRKTVHFPDPLPGFDTTVFKVGIVGASFVIGLAILSPLLRIISKFYKGQLSWQHCLTAFSIGFFGDMTFNLILNSFVGVLKL